MEYYNINFIWYTGKNFENDVIHQFKDFKSIIYNKINDTYLFLINDIEKCKEELSGKTIYSDCRLFSMLISCLNNNVCSFLMQLSIYSPSPEILVPKNVFYFTLDSKLIKYKSDMINLSKALGDMCGQWIIKDDNNNYVGFTKDGILKKNYQEWNDFYVGNIRKKLNILNQTQHDIIMLKINILKNNDIINVNLLSFNSLGDSTIINNSFNEKLELMN